MHYYSGKSLFQNQNIIESQISDIPINIHE